MSKLGMLFVFVGLVLGACHTIAGAGQDVAKTGQALSCAANDALDGRICGRSRIDEDAR